MSTTAQFTTQQYPFPYNPDSNQDGMVSMTDFLEILGLFGQEYPNSFFADSARAILHLGEMGASRCVLQADAAGVDWRVLTIEDSYTFAPLISEGAPYSTDDYGDTFWSWNNLRKHMGYSWIFYDTECASNRDCWVNNDSTAFYTLQTHPYGTTFYLNERRHCFLVTEAKPAIDYLECYDEPCLEEATNDGWTPLGATGYGGILLWRWAE